MAPINLVPLFRHGRTVSPGATSRNLASAHVMDVFLPTRSLGGGGGRLMTNDEREQTLNQLLALVPTGDPVSKISIIPRSRGSLGYTMQMPKEDRYLLSMEELEDQIAVIRLIPGQWTARPADGRGAPVTRILNPGAPPPARDRNEIPAWSPQDCPSRDGPRSPGILGPVGGARRNITVRKFASNEEADRHEAEFWHAMPAHERVLLAWRLSAEQWELMGRKADEPGLCRSVARLQRG